MYRLLLPLLLLSVLRPQAQDVVDATTLSGKTMAGYQGWFRTPGDRVGNNGWSHLFNRDLTRPGFDTWPDMSEYKKDEKTAVPGFTYPNGSQAYLYSGQNAKAVLRHFEWMKQYGIDGVWLSEFCGYFAGGNGQNDSTTVMTIMNNVRAAARATGRTWAFMWDMSSFGARTSKSDVYNIIVNQWKRMVDEGVTSDPRYLHDKGRPVLLIWGFFPGRPASQPDYMNPVLDFLLAPGPYQAALVAGVDDKWRQGTPEFVSMLMRCTALQPWSVGRRVLDPKTGYQVSNTTKWADDITLCQAHNVKYIPVFNSGTHIAGPPPIPPAQPTVPRRMGNYLWEQFVAASRTGQIDGAFIAMFDEINEGTQITKVTNHPPVQFPFLTYDGATSDYYLRLVGLGAKLLRTSTPVPEVIPISPFSEKKAYQLSRPQGWDYKGFDWTILYDGQGYYTLKYKPTGKVLTDGGQLLSGDGSDKQRWHMEWDGSGTCKITNKASGKALLDEGDRWVVEEPMDGH